MNHVANLKHLISVHQSTFGSLPAKLVMNSATRRKLAEALGSECDGDEGWASIPVRISSALPTGSFSFETFDEEYASVS